MPRKKKIIEEENKNIEEENIENKLAVCDHKKLLEDMGGGYVICPICGKRAE